ncbi:MAG: hypothetical protein JWN69_1197 [Alphaproteobacteria bacterium]|nr:hypothetical protein [Alphaproteobacteria bacterium]
MLPFFRYSWVFRSRWLAVVWALGFCWFALDFSGSTSSDDGNNVSAEQAQGAAFTKSDVEAVAATLNSL